MYTVYSLPWPAMYTARRSTVINAMRPFNVFEQHCDTLMYLERSMLISTSIQPPCGTPDPDECQEFLHLQGQYMTHFHAQT